MVSTGKAALASTQGRVPIALRVEQAATGQRLAVALLLEYVLLAPLCQHALLVSIDRAALEPMQGRVPHVPPALQAKK